MVYNLGRMAKAVVAALAAGSSALAVAVQDGTLATGDMVTIALAVLGALGVTYMVPNKG